MSSQIVCTSQRMCQSGRLIEKGLQVPEEALSHTDREGGASSPASKAEDTQASLRFPAASLDPSTYSSIVSDLAEKYGCSDLPRSEDCQREEDTDGCMAASKRIYVPPKLKVVQDEFRQALDAILKAASARTTLVKTLQNGCLPGAAGVEVEA